MGFLAITYSRQPNNYKGEEIATSDYSYATRRGKNGDNSHNKSQIREGHIGWRIVHKVSHESDMREIRYSQNITSPR